jgi:hypothetical protein
MRSVLCVLLVLPALLFGAATAGAQQAPAEPAAAEAKPARKSWVPTFLRNYENPAPRAVLPGTQETAAVSKEPAAETPKAEAKPAAEAAPAKKKSVKKKKKAKKKVAKKKKKAAKPKDRKPEVEPETVREGSHEVAAFETEEPAKTPDAGIVGGRGSVSGAALAMPPVIEPPLTGTPIDTLALYKQAMASGDITGALALFRQTVNTPPDINLVAKLNGLMGVSLSSEQASELVDEVAEFAAVEPPRPASVEAARIHGVHDMIADAAAPSLVVALEHYKSAVAAGNRLAAVQSLTRVLGRPIDDEAARQADALLNLPSSGLTARDQLAVQSGF